MKKGLVVLLLLLGGVCFAESSFVVSKDYRDTIKAENGFALSCVYHYYKNLFTGSLTDTVRITISGDTKKRPDISISCSDLNEIKGILGKIVSLSESEVFVKSGCDINAHAASEKVRVSGRVYENGKCVIELSSSSYTCVEFTNINEIKIFITCLEKAIELNTKHLKDFNSIFQ